ncbi:MAG: DUF192 domain-containing protein [Phycisphaeraceae bacterium]|nr:MAG: DUF192 domain-containing protein [Phycisphaeraceae bacterium]
MNTRTRPIGRAASFAAAALAAFALAACDDTPKDPKSPPKEVKVKIADKTFTLELAMDAQTRFKGLSGRTEIPADRGMLFVFPDAQVTRQEFVMRDCPVDIDIIYLDGSMRITAWHEMKPEPPRADDEKKLSPPTDQFGRPIPNAPEWTWTNEKYEQRLKRYPSKFSAQYVIELKGGVAKPLNLKEGQKIEIDPGLKKLAK